MRTRDVFEILHALADAYLVLTPDLVIVDATDAYLAATMTTREQIVGRYVFDVFPEDPDDREGGGGEARVRSSLTHVMAKRRPHAMPVHRYPIRTEGAVLERFWKVLNTPVLDEQGWVKFIIQRVEDVTELVELQNNKLDRDRELEQVTALSQRYINLLDGAPDATVIVNGHGKIELVNTQAEAMFGYHRDELIGQRLDILIPERFRKTHSEHLGRYFADPGARPMGNGLQLFGRRKDESELPIEVSLSPQRDGPQLVVSAAIRDVTERMKLESAARLNAVRLASAVESIEHAFALFDADDRLISCNSVFRRLAHEPSPGALVGKRYAEVLDGWLSDMVFADDDARSRFRTDRVARRAREPQSVFDIRLHDGRSLRIIDRRTPEGGLVKTVLDRTDDERLAKELVDARAAAEAASAAKSEFLSSMSHELRTPLNAILGFAQLLRRDKKEPLSARHTERLIQILQGGQHLLRLIDDILDLARIEAGSVSISPEPVSVSDVLEEVRSTLEPIASNQSIKLVVEPASNEVPTVSADRTRFVQILMNLGSNAIKYNRPEGSVRFGVELVDPTRVRITVRDTGHGIPLASQAKLFQPFQRAGQETGSIEGTGIGLVITKRLAELMGGSVGFESTPGEGSRFWVELVVHVGKRPRSPTIPIVYRLDPNRVARPQRLVLYVEDNPANVVFMRDLMTDLENIDLVTVPTAELAIDLARARQPDLVLMDINLPGMSGLDALAALRSHRETNDIPVIALTAAASERDRQRGIEAGFYRYLTKPIQIDELITAIESLLG